MARWLSLLLLVGLGSAALTHGWAEYAGPGAPLAADVQETAPAEVESEEARLEAPDAATPDRRATEPGADARTHGQSRDLPSLRPPR